MFRRRPHLSGHPSATVVRRRPSLDFSVTGVIYVAMMLFMGLAAINSQANLLFGVFGLMIGILLVSGVVSRLVLRRLMVHRVLPDHGTVGRPLTMTYDITNGKRFWPSLSVAVSELDGVEGFTTQPQGYMLHAAPRMTASVPAMIVPKRRGLHELGRYQLGTSFPFGFVKRAITDRHPDMLLVYPPEAQVDRKLLAACRSADMGGESMRPKCGGADEFYGVRDYRPGDNPRWVYWRRSARSGTLVTKEMTQVAPPRVVLLVDTCVFDDTVAERAAIERGIAMAGSLAAVALDEGLSVGMCTWTGEWLAVSPTRGKRHRDELLSVLSRLPLNREGTLPTLLEECQRVLHAGTTPVLFTPRDVHLGVLDHGRGGMLVIQADSPRAAAWFRFDPAIDFQTSMPADQQPRLNPPSPGATRAARRRKATAAPMPEHPHRAEPMPVASTSTPEP